MERVCLDTDVLIELLRGKESAVRRIKELEKECELVTTSVNVFELYYGAFKVGREKNILAVKELSRRLEVLDFTSRVAEIAGKISAELEKKGEGVDFRDVFIASAAIANDVPLLTSNVKHFKRFERFGLKLLR